MSPTNIHVKQLTRYSINDSQLWRVGDYLSNTYVSDSSYVAVNTRYGVTEIDEDCVIEDTTGFMSCRL